MAENTTSNQISTAAPAKTNETPAGHLPFGLGSRHMAGYIATMSVERQETIEMEIAQARARLRLQEIRKARQVEGTVVTSLSTAPAPAHSSPETTVDIHGTKQTTGGTFLVSSPVQPPPPPEQGQESMVGRREKRARKSPSPERQREFPSLVGRSPSPEQEPESMVGVRESVNDAEEFSRNANNTVYKNPTMPTIGGQHIYVQVDHAHDDVLQWLRGHAIRGAEHNSADRDPPPRCHPGTRTSTIQKTQDWLGNPEREQKLLWLRGTAGAGKSATVQALAETLSETKRLGATLFFSRSYARSNPRQILSTLAYQFAAQNPSYRNYIAQLMHTDPELLDKTMGEQFRMLIVEPFALKGIRSGTEAWVVALDGLDECDGDPDSGRHSDDVQRDIVRLISDFTRHYPTAPLIWIIASRPETHLKAVFSEPDVVRCVREEELPVDSDEACEDVERFLCAEFTKISHEYPDHIRDSPWPTSNQFLKIAHAALGLFIFAEVIIRFIGDPQVCNPVGQLECILFAISKMQSHRNRENPLANLDEVYRAILSKTVSTLGVTKRILGILIFLNENRVDVSYCNFRCICQILGVSEDVGVTALYHLHSVLYFPRSKNIGATRPRFYHASFQDFLEDGSRSHQYSIDERAFTMALLVEDFVRITQTRFSSGPDLPSSPLLGKEREEIPNDCISVFLNRILYGTFSLDGVHFKTRWMTSSLPDAQLQPLLESLSIIKVMKHDKYALRPLVWDSREHDEHDLCRRGFLCCTTFGSLGINWDTVFLSVSTVALGGFQHVHVHTAADVGKTLSTYISELYASDLEVGGLRQRLKTVASDTKARIWGHPKSDCRVVIVAFEWGTYAITGVPL